MTRKSGGSTPLWNDPWQSLLLKLYFFCCVLKLFQVAIHDFPMFGILQSRHWHGSLQSGVAPPDFRVIVRNYSDLLSSLFRSNKTLLRKKFQFHPWIVSWRTIQAEIRRRVVLPKISSLRGGILAVSNGKLSCPRSLWVDSGPIWVHSDPETTRENYRIQRNLMWQNHRKIRQLRIRSPLHPPAPSDSRRGDQSHWFWWFPTVLDGKLANWSGWLDLSSMVPFREFPSIPGGSFFLLKPSVFFFFFFLLGGDRQKNQKLLGTSW